MFISVTDPVSTAWKRMVHICFTTFDVRKWFVMGLAAWLATLGEGGGSNSVSSSNDSSSGSGDLADVEAVYRDAVHWVEQNTDLLIAIAVGGVVAGVLLGMLINWIKARAMFVFMDNIARNEGEFVIPWKDYATPGNSLFWTRTILDWIMGAFSLTVFGGLAYLVFVAFEEGGARGIGPSSLCLIIPVVLVVVVGYAFCNMMLNDVFAPMMFARRKTFRELWPTFRAEILPGQAGSFILFWMVKVGLGLVAGIVVAIVTTLTCCIAGLPYISGVVLLPVWVFLRSYSMCFIEQLGPDYTMFKH